MEVELESEPIIFGDKVWYFKPVKDVTGVKEELVVVKIPEGYLSLFIKKHLHPTFPSSYSKVIFSNRFNFEVNTSTYFEEPLTKETLKRFKKDLGEDLPLYVRTSTSLFFSLVNNGDDAVFEDKTKTFQYISKAARSLIYGTDSIGRYHVLTADEDRSLEYIYPHELPKSRLISPSEDKIVSILPTDIGCDRRYYEQFRSIVENLEVERSEDYEVFISFSHESLINILSRSSDPSDLYGLFDKFLRGRMFGSERLDSFDDLKSQRMKRLISPNVLTGFKMAIATRDHERVWEITWTSSLSIVSFRNTQKIGTARRVRNIEVGRYEEISKEEARSLLSILPKITTQRVNSSSLRNADYELQSWKVDSNTNGAMNLLSSYLSREYHYIYTEDESVVVAQTNGKTAKIIRFPSIGAGKMNDIEIVGLIQNDYSRDLGSSLNLVIEKFTSERSGAEIFGDSSTLRPLDHELVLVLADLTLTIQTKSTEIKR